MSVVGFDDIDLAWCTDPPLTTVAQQKGEMGRWAFARVAELGGARGAGVRAGARTIRLPTKLVVRASTAQPSAR